MAEETDPVADYLRAAKVPDAVRARAWDAIYQAKDDKDLEQRLRQLPLTPGQRADLFDRRPSTGEHAQGWWEDLGRAGMQWHPPAGSGNELNRPDNQVFWLPPELAALSAFSIGRAVVGGGADAAMTAAGRVAAGAKAAVREASPVIKYEFTKTTLEHLGVPPMIAMPIAMAASGYRGGGHGRTPRTPRRAPATAAPATEAAASVLPVEPVASTPAAQAPRAAASSPVTGPVPAPVSRTASTLTAPPASPAAMWSPQRIQNELGLAARRAKVMFNESEYAQATELVNQGRSPADAVAELASRQPPRAVASPQPVPLPPAAATPGPPRSADEVTEYTRLLRSGLDPLAAMKALEEQRVLAQALGAPTPATARARVTERNATGRWR